MAVEQENLGEKFNPTKQFQGLTDLLGKMSDNLPKNPLDGLIEEVGNLEADSEKVNALFWASLKNSGRKAPSKPSQRPVSRY